MLFSAEARAAALVLAWFSLGCDVGTDYGSTEADTGTAPDGSGGSDSAAPTSVPPTLLPTLFGTPEQVGSGSSSDRWYKTDVERDGSSYFFMANGWGPGFEEQTVSWSGTAFTVESMQGMRGAGYEPATYPTVFCGQYSDSISGSCGLPRALDGMQSLRTGWRWDANGNAGQYNAAYDVWLSTTGDISGHSAFLMVWLRDPKGQQPAGSKRVSGITVANAPGTWNVWAGNVNGKPCISYVRAEGQDSPEIELDVLDFVRDAPTRNLSLPGSTVLSVAVGFEIWSGPVQDLRSQDFYVRVD